MDFTKVSAAPVRLVKQPVPRPRPINPVPGSSSSGRASTSQNGSTSSPHRPTPTTSGKSSASSSTPRTLPKPKVSTSTPSSSSENRSRPSGSTSTSAPVRSSTTKPAARSTGTGTPSRSSTPQRKRKVEQRIESESESSSSSDSASGSGSSGVASKKKSRLNGSSKGSKGRESRSVSAKSARTSTADGGHKRIKKVNVNGFKKGRELWCLGKVNGRADGEKTWEGFVASEAAVRGDLPGWNGGKGSGIGATKYIAYFPQAGFEAPVQDTDPLPTVEVLYPAKGCKEKFVLLVPPLGTFEYNPVAELKGILTAILDHYIPPSHRAIFGTLSTSIDVECSSSRPTATPSAAPSPRPQAASLSSPARNAEGSNGHGGRAMTETSTNVAGHFPQSMPTPVPSAPCTPLPLASDPFVSIDPSTPTSTSATAVTADSASAAASAGASAITSATSSDSTSIGTALRRALAPNRRDGPGLVAAIERYNTAMAQLQDSGEMEKWLEEHQKDLGAKEWSAVCERINEMAYARVVGPYSKELEHHPKHPEEVAKVISGKEDSYGELRHNIISLTGLSPSSVFLDLGSGVGNCILQTALQAGCESYGVELLPVPSHCARLQLVEAKKRWAMWGVNGNEKVEVEEGDMRGNARVAGWVRRADVVLVNNEVFSPSLNDDLKNMFLDLKDGAKIVSLKPFVNEGFRMNESNLGAVKTGLDGVLPVSKCQERQADQKCDAFDAICRVTKHNYYHSWVSWKGDMGEFYVHEMDRKPRLEFEKRLQRGGGRASRSGRR